MQIDPTLSLNVQHYLQQMAITRVLDQLDAEPLWRVTEGSGGVMLLDRMTGLLWDGAPNRDTKMDRAAGNETVATLNLGGLRQWRIPTLQELKQLGTLSKTICHHGNLRTAWQLTTGLWLTTSGTWSFDHSLLNEGPQTWGSLVAVNDFIGDISREDLIHLCLERSWTLAPVNADPEVNILTTLTDPPIRDLFADIDYATARLPRLDAAYFDDPTRGLWELWGLDQDSLRAHQVRARNPADDVLDWDVAIDFGTSSTVVAYNDNGRRRLLRVGMARFWETEQPNNYENPTALEFRNLEHMLADWRSMAYRPHVKWDDVRCAHAALQCLEDPDTILQIIPDVLTGLKQWAMRTERDPRVYVRNSDKRQEYEIQPLMARNPVLGTPLTIGADDPFDPIELYAWFLGMNINWRGRGLFLRYYMTFPVAYPEHVRDKILASFRRGLQRSLPATLVTQPIFAKFRVDELATEPAAYAAAALPALEIEPTTAGVAYAVFDFGGGTTDFDFGRYRLPNETEDDELEEVLEHCGSSGDAYLGGEHLLANMAYLVFQHSLEFCLEQGVTFTRPEDADDFSGHEMYVENSRIASTNMAAMITALRPLWENGFHEGVPNKQIRLLSRAGVEVEYELIVPVEPLRDYLIHRIGEGIRSFFVAMGQAFGDAPPSAVHILLAGNGCRSEILKYYFFSESGSELFAGTADFLSEAFDGKPVPDISVHRAPDDDVHNLGMGKAGVALGLLRLCPGGAVTIKQAASNMPEHEAPFTYFVGRIRHKTFQPLLWQAQPYGIWVDVGRPRDRVLKLSYTRSPLAHTGELVEGDKEVAQRRLEFSDDADGKRVFVRAIGPHDIEVCIAASLDDIHHGAYEELQTISLL